MAFEPIVIFSHRIDPAGVVDLLRAAADDVTVSGPSNDRQQIVVVFAKEGLIRESRVLTFDHNASYYSGPDWPKQVAGMQGYFSRFPDSPVKPDVIRVIGSFRFSIAVPQDDLDINSADERLALVYAVCRHLDGVIYTPSSLRDAAGRILIDANGYSDPDAVLPALPLTADHEQPTSDNDDEYDDEPNPPSALRVARRTLALTAVVARATLEVDAPKMADPDAHRQRILTWIEEVGIGDELEPDEWKAILCPTGTLNEQATLDSMWRVEGLAVLAWALQLHPIPPYDELADPDKLFESIGLFNSEAGKHLLAAPNLRPPEELAGMENHLLAFHWRMRDFFLRPDAMNFVEFSRDCWFGSFDIECFQIINDDLAIGQYAISDAPEEKIRRALSTAMERHLAINWLMGDSEVYSDTHTST
jgi:hypothetical protein